MVYYPFPVSAPFLLLLSVVSIWTIVWKGIALWKSARNGQLAWFLVFIVINTAGILEIAYIAFFQKKGQILVTKKRK